MDFENVSQTFNKLDEEILELKNAVNNGNIEEIKLECGDLLFTAINVIRKLGVDGETALNASTDKFIKRFEKTEKLITLSGKNIKNLTAEEVDFYYCKSKE